MEVASPYFTTEMERYGHVLAHHNNAGTYHVLCAPNKWLIALRASRSIIARAPTPPSADVVQREFEHELIRDTQLFAEVHALKRMATTQGVPEEHIYWIEHKNPSPDVLKEFISSHTQHAEIPRDVRTLAMRKAWQHATHQEYRQSRAEEGRRGRAEAMAKAVA